MTDWHDEVGSASRGDPDAIAALLERHLPRLRAFVRLRMGRELRRRESASDLVQSACREVLRQADRYRYRSEANFRSWLFTTALRKVRDRIDYWQADKRDAARDFTADDGDVQDVEHLAGVYADFATPSAQLEAKERIARLEAAFDRLPDEYREVITLARIVRLPHREVAAAMGRSEVASRGLLYRALSALGGELAAISD